MTARRPRRSRRAASSGSTLPRPAAGKAGAVTVTSSPAPTKRRERPEHHVSTDYRYVRKDLISVAVVSVVTLGFVLAMGFVI